MPNGCMCCDVTARTTDIESVTDSDRVVFDGPIGPDDSDSPHMSWTMDGERRWAAVVAADEVTTGRWVPHVHVVDLDVAVTAAADAGGTVAILESEG